MCASLILIPFISVLILNLPIKGMKRLAFGLAALLFLLQMVAVLIPDAAFWKINHSFCAGIFNFELGADILSKVVLFCIGMVSLVTLFSALTFVKDSDEKFNFINILLIAVCGMNAVAMAKDIFSLYVFLEVVAVSSFILIAFNRDMPGLEGRVQIHCFIGSGHSFNDRRHRFVSAYCRKHEFFVDPLYAHCPE